VILFDLNIQHHAGIIFNSNFIDSYPFEVIVFKIVFQINALPIRRLDAKESLKERRALICSSLNTIGRHTP
jgi:hypothetical protein